MKYNNEDKLIIDIIMAKRKYLAHKNLSNIVNQIISHEEIFNEKKNLANKVK